jgi:hypothetical protein
MTSTAIWKNQNMAISVYRMKRNSRTSSQSRFLVKTQIENIIKHTFWDVYFSKYILPSNGVMSQRCYVTTKSSFLGYARHTAHSRAQLWSNDRTHTHTHTHTHDGHCGTPLTLGVCNSQLEPLHGNILCVTLVDVVETTCVDDCSSASVRQEV